jgi:Carbohydrate family 9 binding domain-like
LYAGDSVEVYLDTATDKDITTDAYQTHQGKFVCAPPNAGSPNGRVHPMTKRKQGVFDDLDLDKVAMVSHRTAAGYVIELKVPFRGRELSAGTVFGFDVNYIDQDGEPFYKKIQLAWAGKDSWSNPHGLGFIVLVAAGQ